MKIKKVLIIILSIMIPITSYADSNEILIDKRININETSFPLLTQQTYNEFNKVIPINFVNNSNWVNENHITEQYSAFANKFFTEDKNPQNLLQIQDCSIYVNIDLDNEVFSEPESVTKSLSYKTLRGKNMKNFLMLHELAHCLDDEPTPKGINEYDWRESLADAYAATTLYYNNNISQNMLYTIANFRQENNSRKNAGDVKILKYLAQEENSIKSYPNLSIQDIYKKMKQVRKIVLLNK